MGVNSQSMGIGGGFIMTIYMANGTKLALIARETAPAAAYKDMYNGNANLTHYGPLASGVPGFVAGTWELKQRLGNPAVTWEHLIQPSVDMCFEGITVNNHGTCQHSFLSPDGDAVSVTASINLIWGC